jgi:hypothetical protein
MDSYCWNCSQIVKEKINFQSICEHCSAYLHSCRGCRFFELGKPNSCRVPGTDPIRDREAKNFCDEFKPIEGIKTKKDGSLKDIEKNLFKD